MNFVKLVRPRITNMVKLGTALAPAAKDSTCKAHGRLG